MDHTDLGRWIASYAAAWEERDPDAVAPLFSDDATYRSVIFNEAHQGRVGVHSYWTSATSYSSEISVRMGTPIADGDRVALEWWTTMIDEGEEITLPGVLLLLFDPSGRCTSLREYWAFQPGHAEPYDGWGEVSPGDTERTRADQERWADGYRSAWLAGDAEAAAELCAEDVIYRTEVLRPPTIGREAVQVYTQQAYESESDMKVSFGRPFADGGTAAVEWWFTYTDLEADPPAQATLAGCSVQTFAPDGLVQTSRDYWRIGEGIHEPPPEWGT